MIQILIKMEYIIPIEKCPSRQYFDISYLKCAEQTNNYFKYIALLGRNNNRHKAIYHIQYSTLNWYTQNRFVVKLMGK